jgi:hypothetical protein
MIVSLFIKKKPLDSGSPHDEVKRYNPGNDKVDDADFKEL